MYGGVLDGEHVCKICFTLYVDEDPWDRQNLAEREQAERYNVDNQEKGRWTPKDRKG